MNALVSYRANALGNLSVTRSQRDAAAAEITSTYRAKLQAVAKSTATTKAASTSDTSSSATSISEVASNELGRDAFLQLLVLELQNQDPLSPVDNSEMIAQLAQFSSLEQMEALNTSFETLSGNVDQLNFINAQGLLGKYVEALGSDGQPVVGTVDSVYLDGSIVVLNVDGEIVSMSSVLSISNEAPESTSSEDTDSSS